MLINAYSLSKNLLSITARELLIKKYIPLIWTPRMSRHVCDDFKQKALCRKVDIKL